eukprot:scaffold18873_cov112-Isochrysis_galbana.AAC.7
MLKGLMRTHPLRTCAQPTNSESTTAPLDFWTDLVSTYSNGSRLSPSFIAQLSSRSITRKRASLEGGARGSARRPARALSRSTA